MLHIQEVLVCVYMSTYALFFNSPSLLTTYRPRKPVAPNTVAAIPLEEERPPFPLGMTAWCSFLCCPAATEAADSTAGEQLPPEKRGTQVVLVSTK